MHTAVERGHPLRRLAPCSPTRRPPSKASSQSCHQTRVSKQEDTTCESCDMDTTTLDPAGACALCRAGSCCRAQPAVCQVSLPASVVNGVGQGAAEACHELHVASHFEGTRGKRPLHAACHQAVNAGNELIAAWLCPMRILHADVLAGVAVWTAMAQVFLPLLWQASAGLCTACVLVCAGLHARACMGGVCCCHTRCHTHMSPYVAAHSAPPHNLALSPNLTHVFCLRLMPCSLARGVRWAYLC